MFSRTVLKLFVSYLFCASCSSHTDLWHKFHEAVVKHGGEWASGQDERRGQICDPTRRFGDMEAPQDNKQGCAVLWVADPKDEFGVKDLPVDQQDNFQNTQHYKAAWNFHGNGLKGDSLPMAAHDIEPVCYLARVNNTVVMGYEEGNGGDLLPCPGAKGAYPFTEKELLDAKDDSAKLEEMCDMCYQAVCSSARSIRAQSCGDDRHGGVDVGESNRRRRKSQVAAIEQQVNPAYHCHIAMNDQGTCDYVQYNQHEATRNYHMEYGVMCGWKNIKHLNLTHCDCTVNAGKANGCGRQQCLELAYEGVVCGNCGGCDQNRAFAQIFTPPVAGNIYKGACTAVRTAKTEEEVRKAKMICSRGLFCRGNDLKKEGCPFHCETFPEDDKCPANRRLRGKSTVEAPNDDTLIDRDSILAEFPAIRRGHGSQLTVSV